MNYSAAEKKRVRRRAFFQLFVSVNYNSSDSLVGAQRINRIAANVELLLFVLAGMFITCTECGDEIIVDPWYAENCAQCQRQRNSLVT